MARRADTAVPILISHPPMGTARCASSPGPAAVAPLARIRQTGPRGLVARCSGAVRLPVTGRPAAGCAGPATRPAPAWRTCCPGTGPLVLPRCPCARTRGSRLAAHGRLRRARAVQRALTPNVGVARAVTPGTWRGASACCATPRRRDWGAGGNRGQPRCPLAGTGGSLRPPRAVRSPRSLPRPPPATCAGGPRPAHRPGWRPGAPGLLIARASTHHSDGPARLCWAAQLRRQLALAAPAPGRGWPASGAGLWARDGRRCAAPDPSCGLPRPASTSRLPCIALHARRTRPTHAPRWRSHAAPAAREALIPARRLDPPRPPPAPCRSPSWDLQTAAARVVAWRHARGWLPRAAGRPGAHRAAGPQRRQAPPARHAALATGAGTHPPPRSPRGSCQACCGRCADAPLASGRIPTGPPASGQHPAARVRHMLPPALRAGV